MCKVNTIRETIRTTRLYASPALKSEYGPELWADKRKAAFGRLRLVNDPAALPVDSFHMELVEMDPSSFTDGLLCLSDMLDEMLEYMQSSSRDDDAAEEFAYRLDRMTAERDELAEELARVQSNPSADVAALREEIANLKNDRENAWAATDRYRKQYEALAARLTASEPSATAEQPAAPTDEEIAAHVKTAAEQLPGVAVTVKGGCYVWVSGETKPVAGQLKALGCRWSPKRSAWYWSPSCKRVSA